MIRVLYFTLVILISIPIRSQKVAGYVHKSSTSYEWPTKKEVLEKLDKWQDKKFGVLLSWGLYSSLGLVESWSLSSADGDRTYRRKDMTYEEFKNWYWGIKDTWNPRMFNPQQWANVMEQAGIKYMIFTTKHHDGFCMYDSKFTDFSISKGAFKNNPNRDVAKHVFDAFRNKNFMVGVYFSKPDWHSNYYWWNQYATPNRFVNYDIKKNPKHWSKFQEFTSNQILELMTDYGDIDILWLDGGWVSVNRGEDIKIDDIVSKVRNIQDDILVVDRTVVGQNENYQTPERSIPKKQLNNPWESCITLSNDWGWRECECYKSSRKIISLLSEIVAKGGCLLLGVGPNPEGLIDEKAANVLKEVGDWLKVNGDAIYNTRNTPLYNYNNIWFTTSKDHNKLYAIYTLEDGKDLPEFIEWKGNLPANKIKLLQKNCYVKYKIRNDTIKIKLPKQIKQETLVLTYEPLKKQ